MKRIVAVFLLVLMALTSVFALSNSQKIYRVDSKEYEEIKYLYISQVMLFLPPQALGLKAN